MIYHKLPRTSDTSSLVRLGIFASIFLIIVGAIYSITHYSSTPFKSQNPDDTTILIRVGDEDIYYRDLSTEISSYPNPTDESVKGILTQKLVADSIILQGGRDEGFIELTSDFFNSPDKNYSKRMEMVETVKKHLNKNSLSTEGYVVSIWFRNNGYIGPKGLSLSKEFARKKINALHEEVVSGRMSIQKAGDIIKNDSSLKEVDIAYKNNAIFPFTVYSGDAKKITLNSDLDDELQDLNKGEVSGVYVGIGKDPSTGESYEALYMFGQITDKRNTTQNYVSFEDWLMSKKQIYTVGR